VASANAGAGVVVVAVLLVSLVRIRGGGGHTVTAEFLNGGRLGPGNPVRVAGADVGTVEDLSISKNGEALIRFTVVEEYAPLRRGTRAMIKQTSLSGIANRYVTSTWAPQTARRSRTADA
jgi:phospholipid/cholesterol/gamma-HCH transport system substrate-binding protein